LQNWKERTAVEKENRVQVTTWKTTENSWNSQRRLVVIVNYKT